MTEEQIAYLFSKAAELHATLEGMKDANRRACHEGGAIPHSEGDFQQVPETLDIAPNALTKALWERQ